MANEKRLIDAKALMDEFRRYMADHHDCEKCASEDNCKTCDRGCLWRKTVNNAPTVDAAEVVRCKDCKYYKPRNQSVHWKPTALCCTRSAFMQFPPDGFCSYGERGRL